MSPINLEKHAVVEASAGTGKTYAIEELVLDLLTVKQVRLEQILVVTYTEKAAGDLKERLRARLEQALDKMPEHQEVLREALDGFDQAHVYTIHGFCQRVLQEHAFENGQDFRSQLVYDRDLLEPCLREIQRKEWCQEFGNSLAAVLELSGYNRQGGGEAWERLVRQVAERFRPGCNHGLLPEPLPNWPGLLPELETRIGDLVRQLRQLAGSVDFHRPEEHCWHLGFGQLPFRQDWRESRRRELLVPLLEWLADPEAGEHPQSAWQKYLGRMPSSAPFQEHGLRLLTVQLPAKARSQLAQLCPNLSEAVDAVEELRRQIDWPVLEKQLAIQTVKRLQEHLEVFKRERGLVSFEEMLTRVDKALDPQNARAGALRAALRSRFRYAIVDEFQDTDPIQWRIFKRIFVEGGGEQRLFVVGDPKQAIFAFRGADLDAYLSARRELMEQFGACAIPLNINWRSCPELLTALNHLFARGSWFAGGDISYTQVQAPPEADQLNKIPSGQDRTGRPALTLVDLAGAEKLSEARQRYAGFIVEEIRRLLGSTSGSPALEFESKGQSRRLQAGDICILVFKRREAGPVLEALGAARIPYTFYKQPGLWQSPEAVHLGYLLRAISRPGEIQAFKKALLTRFFRIRPEELASAEDLPSSHPAQELFQRWYGLAEKRQWAELFQSLLEDTGVLFHDGAQTDPDRSLANYRHLCRTLEQAAYAQDLDMLGILELFEEMRRRPGDEETALQPIETEKPKVCILTIHASKGLQYPVVFLAGGFTAGRPPAVLTYRNDQGNLVFDLRSGDQRAKAACQQERDAEERRLLYVALTRAMFKLYLPRVSGPGYRQPGPVVEILAPAIEQSALATLGSPLAELVRPAEKDCGLRIADCGMVFRNPLSAIENPQLCPNPQSAIRNPQSCELAEELFPRVDPFLARRRILIRSFSSLHRQGRTGSAGVTPALGGQDGRTPNLVVPEGLSYLERRPRGDDDRQDPLEVQTSLRGPVFGDMVHDTLAELDFAAVAKAAAPADLLQEDTASRLLVDTMVSRHLSRLSTRLEGEQLREECRRQIAGLVWKGLRTPLAAVGRPLCQVPWPDRLHELEFHFPQWEGEKEVGNLFRRMADSEEPFRNPQSAIRNPEEGFLTGFMDLVFRVAGKYFLVDWKTNTLPGSYTPTELARSMVECDYLRQYRLYLQALARWLQRVHGPAFPFAEEFGGVYYLFLRGMNGQDETSGVFFRRPSPEDLRPESSLGA